MNLKLTLSLGLAVAFALTVGAGSASASPLYSGQLSSADGGLIGTGAWVDTPATPATIAWSITDNANGTYHYQYTLTPSDVGGISHVIIETSANFTSNDIKNASGSFQLGLWSPDTGNSNPNMPDDVYGLEFTSGTISFDSDRLPVWGDFYAKGGKNGGDGQNSIWNAGFTSPEFNPGNPPANGSVGNEILVPDSANVPEPATISLLGAGLAGLIFVRRRAK